MTRLKYPYENFSLKPLKGELWDDIPYLDGAYEISNYGRVKSNRRYVERPKTGGFWTKEKIIKTHLSRQPVSRDTRSLYRLSVTVSFEGKKTAVPIARLVYYLFNKKFDLTDRTLVVSMKDEDNMNIRPKNLTLTSPSANIKKAYAKNRRELASFGNKAASISQYDLQGKWVQTYQSISFAARATGLSSSQIARALKNSQGYTGNHLWRYGKKQATLSKIPKRVTERLDSQIFHASIVTQYDLSGKRICQHENLKAAAIHVGAQPNLIRKVILGSSISAKNYYWQMGPGPDQISMEHIEKRKLKSRQKIRRPVTQYDLAGNRIKTFISISEASRSLGTDPMNIMCALKKEGSSTASGFLWTYGQGKSKIKIKPRVRRLNELRQIYASPVSQYNQKGLRIATHKSLLDASKATKTPLISLVKCITGKSLSHKNTYWRKGRGPLKIQLNPLSEAHQQYILKVSRPVTQYTLDGRMIREFPSLGAASKTTNTSVSQIRMVANRTYKSAKGYIWKFKSMR